MLVALESYKESQKEAGSSSSPINSSRVFAVKFQGCTLGKSSVVRYTLSPFSDCLMYFSETVQPLFRGPRFCLVLINFFHLSKKITHLNPKIWAFDQPGWIHFRDNFGWFLSVRNIAIKVCIVYIWKVFKLFSVWERTGLPSYRWRTNIH